MHTGVIAAISTPPGKGGVALIRVSGAGAVGIAGELFRPMSGKDITDYPERYAIYGEIICNGRRFDDGILTRFAKDRSYTGEEMVEISCHGGVLITRTILEELFRLGANPAEAGEFTRRAFLSGKLSLTDAEAIGTLLEAKTEEQILLSSLPSRTRLAGEIAAIRASIVELLGSIMARVDYPEEDLGDFTDAEVQERLLRVRESLTALISTYRTGRAINEGIDAVICGKPNVGKSTLYNAILGEDAAIVTDTAGTTRDLLEHTATLGRVLVRLTDTAGIRPHALASEVERIGIDRARARVRAADLIIAVFDLTRPLDGEDRDILALLSECDGAKICLFNKSDDAVSVCLDTSEIPDIFDLTYTVSAKCSESDLIDKLSRGIDTLFTDERISVTDSAIVASARQHAALTRALGFIDTALEAYRLGIPADAASSDIELALGALGEVDGRTVSDDVVSNIFSRFCVGK